MSIATMKLTGITWGEGQDLLLNGKLIPLETPVELTFKKPVDQALVDQVLQALQAKQALTLTVEVGVKTPVWPNELAKQQSETAPDQGTELATSADQVEEAEPGEHLQSVDETQDFDPEAVGSAVADHLASTAKVDQTAPKLNVPATLPSQGHPEPFTATDFEQPTNQQTVNQPTIFGADGDKLTREEVDDTPESDSLPGL
ncbi:hypothetical protein NAB2_3222 [Lactiplantibacillus plantarum]|uniref:Uncharacterized protein n=1 Tax=Lactiplantibacillus plantarum TaxID=1590 RepID=A0AAW3RCK7_LACPN|nr:hypothetical protein [Lactiplantibacillus plantarum]KZV00478.1 hypothetical protein NAB2_3222 [Lactiplantibacillus plantarum]